MYPLNALVLPLQLVALRLRGYSVLHLHWLAFYLPPGFGPKLNLLFSRFVIWLIGALRFRVVWTVHNVVPHRPETADDQAITRRVAEVADLLLNSSAAREELEAVGVAAPNAPVIPHGNYDGIYHLSQDRQAVRASLSIAKDDPVVLFFGKIAPYKGVPELITAFRKIADPGVHLIIAGLLADPDVEKELATGQPDRRITLLEGTVAEGDVAGLFAAADVVALPFRRITTSGSALLAMTLERPVIAPLQGSIVDLPRNAGFFYDPSDPAGLESSLAAALGDVEELQRRGRAARDYADELSWDRIAESVLERYRLATRAD